MADTGDLKSPALTGVRVRAPPSARALRINALRAFLQTKTAFKRPLKMAFVVYFVVCSWTTSFWETREMSFADKWDAFDWMFRNQLGRRNLTDEQQTYVLGKLYEARKHVHGKTQKRNSDGTVRRRQSDANGGRIRDEIAAEQNVGAKTVDRAGQYAKGIDAIRNDDPELADAILEVKKSS